ncbi:glycosyltransferase family 4 protein [Bacillus cereus group sp. TH230-1LC]|nr:glycosyltransferase family 4 protein [Bacillus cereus group sp. TH230-1LC]
MNILWLVNVPLPEASVLMGERPTPFGGWLVNASTDLVVQEDIKLSIAFPKQKINDVQILEGKEINYYSFPGVRNKNSNEKNEYLTKIIKQVKPDIIHIFGTEYAHTLDMVNICKEENLNVVISIQGLVSIYAKHYMACLPGKIQKRFTFRDFIKQDNLIQQQKKFQKRGDLEIEAIRQTKHVIGRTTWDKACTTQINPNVRYHFCNETLREEFYKHTWSLDNCQEYSIFVSQGSYPIKGLHFVIEAMPLVLRKYPNAKLYIGGQDITKSNTFGDKLKITSYGKYIKELILKYKLQENVEFTGVLNEEQMCERYLRSNVFVCPSSIENSPNSLGEAMILGLPCIASDVGGVSDLLVHGQEGFIYQTDAPYMLAYYINEIFSRKERASDLAKKARRRAMITHNRTENTKKIISIYENIIKNDDFS